jgi:hypothetical protein
LIDYDDYLRHIDGDVYIESISDEDDEESDDDSISDHVVVHYGEENDEAIEHFLRIMQTEEGRRAVFARLDRLSEWL